MGYVTTLDEADEQDLRDELQRRHQMRQQGRCDYCGQPWETPSCKFPERHSAHYVPVTVTATLTIENGS